MLQNIRDNSQGWIAKTIIGVIVALMALTGFDAIFKATTHNNEAAKVNGEQISQNELSQAVDMQRRQLMQQLGKDFDASLLDEKMLRESALKADRPQTAAARRRDSKFAFSEAAWTR
jgi:peptidyl-prolyl cis-trans isomerase D